MPSEEATVPITINWQKSSFSSEGSACVELGIATEGTVLLRESDDPTTVLSATPRRIRSLLLLATGSSSPARPPSQGTAQP
jgi:hypothetical protein